MLIMFWFQCGWVFGDRSDLLMLSALLWFFGEVWSFADLKNLSMNKTIHSTRHPWAVQGSDGDFLIGES